MGGLSHPRRSAQPMIKSAAVSPLSADVVAVFVAKSARTFCYGFLGIVLPVYLTTLGMSVAGVGVAITLTLAGSAVLTWAIRWPAERLGPRAPLLTLTALSAASALLLLGFDWAPLVVLAAVVGNIAVGTGETGPFLTIEQVVIARAVSAARRTHVLGLYNFLGYAAGALGAGAIGRAPGYRALFVVFLAAAVVQAVAYSRWRIGPSPARSAHGAVSSAPLLRRFPSRLALDPSARRFGLQLSVGSLRHQPHR